MVDGRTMKRCIDFAACFHAVQKLGREPCGPPQQSMDFAQDQILVTVPREPAPS